MRFQTVSGICVSVVQVDREAGRLTVHLSPVLMAARVSECSRSRWIHASLPNHLGKNTFAWGFGRYKFRHEPIFYSHVAGQKDAWYGDKSQSTLWEEKKPSANRLHPTMKPVELVERALLNSSKAGDVVVDLFGGSGSTLIGCERRGRKAM